MEVVNQRGMRFPGKGFALILLLSGLFGAYLLYKPGGSHMVTLIDNLTQGLLEGVGLLLTLPLWLPRGDQMGPPAVTSPQPGTAATSFTQRWVPLLLGLGILSYIIGQAIWTYNENIAHLHMLFPSLADIGYLGSYPFVLLAILLMPHRPLPVQTRIRVFLDGLIIMVGVVIISWYFVLGPTILQGADTVAGQIIGTAYPLATLVLIFCLLLLSARSHEHEMQPMVLLLALALITIVVTDSIYDYLQLHNLYATGGLLDVGWPLGYMLVGLGAHCSNRSSRKKRKRPLGYMLVDLGARTMRKYHVFRRLSTAPVPAPVPSPGKSESIGRPALLRGALVLLLFVSAAVLLQAWTEYKGANTGLDTGVSLGATILLGLMVVRQALVIQEMTSQNRLLRRIQLDLWERNEALQQANVQLEEQARIEGAYEQQRRLNEMKDQFVLNVSHELRTPLTQVYGYLELLETYHKTLTSDKQVEYIRKATRGCETLLPLINTILDAPGAGSYKTPILVEDLFVADLVYEVLEQCEPLQRREHPVYVEITKGLAVLADRQFLCQVLRNLLYNAFKYSPPQTPVRVAAARYGPGAQYASDTSQVCICVQDTGPGIPPEDIPLLFGKFVRLKRDLAGPIRGTGLGLYISKQLVETMGGRIWVESSGVAGQGSRFYFTLPASTCDQTRRTRLGSPVPMKVTLIPQKSME